MTGASSRLFRFIGRAPSVFAIPDDPEAQRTLKGAIRLEIEPDPISEKTGWVSWWRAYSTIDEEYIKAGFAARRTRQKLIALHLPEAIMAGVAVLRETPDSRAFACIASLHCEVDCSTPGNIEALVEIIAAALQRQPEQVVSTVTKAEIGNFIAGVYEQCRSAGGNPDLGMAEPWVRQRLRS